jgi:integrase
LINEVGGSKATDQQVPKFVDTSHRIHDLRHAAATYLHDARIPLLVIMDILGHSMLPMTHPTATLRRDAREGAREDVWSRLLER